MNRLRARLDLEIPPRVLEECVSPVDKLAAWSRFSHFFTASVQSRGKSLPHNVQPMGNIIETKGLRLASYEQLKPAS